MSRPNEVDCTYVNLDFAGLRQLGSLSPPPRRPRPIAMSIALPAEEGGRGLLVGIPGRLETLRALDHLA
jgi:hypothetical protein